MNKCNIEGYQLIEEAIDEMRKYHRLYDENYDLIGQYFQATFQIEKLLRTFDLIVKDSFELQVKGKINNEEKIAILNINCLLTELKTVKEGLRAGLKMLDKQFDFTVMFKALGISFIEGIDTFATSRNNPTTGPIYAILGYIGKR